MLKNVTLSAEAALIDRARQRAATESRTLNAAFREWLAGYVPRDNALREYNAVMKRLAHVRLRGGLSREELNERR